MVQLLHDKVEWLGIAQPLSEGEKYGMTSNHGEKNGLSIQDNKASSAPLLIPHNRCIGDCGGNVKIQIAGEVCCGNTSNAYGK
jgi:hypothetical protein